MAETKIIINANSSPRTSGLGVRPQIRELAQFLLGLLSGAKSGTDVSVYVDDSDAVAAAAVVTAAAVASADTVSVNGTALTATSHTARGTITCASVDVSDACDVGGEVFTAAAAEDLEAGEFDQSGTDAQCATSLAACINANATLAAILKAKAVSNVVHIKYLTAGTAGNSVVLTSTDGTDLAVSGSGTLAGGAARANNQFDFHAQWNDDTAADIARAINASSTALVSGQVSAAAVDDEVTITALTPGVTGNAITIATSNGSRLAITGSLARLAGGTDATANTFSLSGN